MATMSQSGGPIQRDNPEPKLDQEMKDETLEDRLAVIQGTFLHMKNEFTALCQRIEQKGSNVGEIDLLAVETTMDQFRELEQKMTIWKRDVAHSVMRTGKYPINIKVDGHNNPV
ncbi:uncharacterized protein MELLADRAFT_110380 [Melampsora larici-populina 98AG31]|uniref:Uncharacterized protein n=1 Tax=Melampsora larici-populina (strain 98AG31 / pathotype 3-4-7) TaxID=747676 RepID=F4RZL9_MELLP|nr:uncharacterized protein MELLADRAFT_110380 [Melampsora larici-populina 98AG31]EGG02166.1 hypothetical protein MELLADRAFT_110380 [Melampsora larici-populina 98AG31]